MSKHDIFISYSKKDSEFAIKLADDLIGEGHKVWIDRSLQVGEDWEQTIENKLEEASEVIVILSSSAIASKWVQHEGSIAYGLKKQMYPVLIEELSPGDLPIWVGKYQYHSFLGIDYVGAFQSLSAILTPPNLFQELLDQQVNAYHQTGELMGEAILRVIEENKDILAITSEASELIKKSHSVIANREQREFQLQSEKESSEKLRLEEQNQSNIKLRRGNRLLVTAFIVTLLFAIGALWFGIQSRRQTRYAQANQLAAISQSSIEKKLDYAILLSIEGILKNESTTTKDTLLQNLLHYPKLERYISHHSNRVESVAISRDNKILASGSWDSTILLWDIENGKQLVDPLIGHTEIVNSVAFSLDGKLLASAGSDNLIFIWDVTTGKQIGKPLNGHKDNVTVVVFSPKGILISGSSDGSIRIWEPIKGKQVGILVDHNSPGIRDIRVYAELAAAVRHRWVCELTNPQMVRKMLV